MAIFQQSTVTIFIADSGDHLSERCFEILSGFAELGGAKEFLVCSSGQPKMCRVHGVSDETQVAPIFDILASVRNLERVRLVALTTEGARENASKIAEASRELRRLLAQQRGDGTRIDDLRVLAPQTGEKFHAERFFSGVANANLILIPHDRLSDNSFAREVPASDIERFAAHLAVELASVSGLWASMHEGPFDDRIPPPARDQDPQVLLVRSMVRAMKVPGASFDRAISEHHPLPLPTSEIGFVRSTDPTLSIERVAAEALPEEFMFHPGQRIEVKRPSVRSREAWNLFKTKFGLALRRTPRTVVSSITEDFDVFASDAVQDAIGRESWMEVLVPNYDGLSPDRFTSERNVDAAIVEIERADSALIMAELGDSAWRKVVEIPFGVADGGGTAVNVRSLAGDARFLVTDREMLAPRPAGDAETTIAILLEAIDREVSDSGTVSVGNEDLDLANSDGGIDDVDGTEPPVTNEQEASPSASHAVNDDADVSEMSDAADDEATSPDLTLENEPIVSTYAGENEEPSELSDESIVESLLVRIGKSIRLQQREATDHLEYSLNRIRAIADENSRNDQHEVSVAKRLLLALGLGIAVFGGVVFTGLAKYSSLEWLDSFWVKCLWVSIAAISVGMTLVVAWAKSARRIIRVLAVTAILGAAYAIAVAPWIRDRPFVRNHIGYGRWVAWPLTAAVLLAALVVLATQMSDDDRWRKALARINVQFSLLFVFLCVIVGASSYKSFLQPVARADAGIIARVAHLSDPTRQRLLFISLAVGAALVAAVLGKIAIEQVRKEMAREKWSGDLLWFISEARRSSSENRKLELLFGQWLGTAAVLSRVIWSPGGVPTDGEAHLELASLPSLDLKKFSSADLTLTARGNELLTDRIRSSIIHPGWLTAQYDRVSESFVASTPRIINERVPRDEWRMPESCQSVASLSDIVNGLADGDRWSFARALFDCDFDPILASISDSIELGDLYGSVIHASDASRIDDKNLGSATAQEFFESLMPTKQQKLPNGLVEGVVFISDDPKAEMHTSVVWPSAFTGLELTTQDWIHELKPDSRVGASGGIVTAVRVDSSKSFALSEVAGGFSTPELGDLGDSQASAAQADPKTRRRF